jgi:hypothetical protein
MQARLSETPSINSSNTLRDALSFVDVRFIAYNKNPSTKKSNKSDTHL